MKNAIVTSTYFSYTIGSMRRVSQLRLRGLSGALVGIVAFGAWLSTSMAAEEKGCCMVFPWSKVKNATAGNGITVDPPKVFDNRSLVLMSEQLSAQLSRLSTVDQAKLSQSVGLLQGMHATEVARSLSVSTLPLPGTQLTEQRDAKLNTLVPSQRVTTTAAPSATAPTLPAEALPALSPSGYGIAAQDILSEEMNLTYQIFNLRMLLEGSISDRLGPDAPRAQVVLGFQVSLDPMKRHRNQAAMVEVELTPVTAGQRPPSLVSLMPQAKSYNVAALSKKSNAFGASAVIKVVTVGYSERHSGESYYLYRDTDTVALERRADPNKLVFGWEFRPVLNREAVEPGFRQLFAVVALDAADDFATAADFKVNFKIRTYWAKFDKKRAVIGSRPYDEVLDAAATELTIPCSKTIQESLGPKIVKVELKAAGEGTVLIDISGNNFFNGTAALIGDRLLDSTTPGFLLKDDHLLQILANVTDLASGKILVKGRYGLSAEVVDEEARKKADTMPDSFYMTATFPPFAQQSKTPVTIRLHAAAQGTAPPDLKNRLVLLTIGGKGFALEPDSWRADTAGRFLETHVEVKAEWLQENTPAIASIPFVPGRSSRITLSSPVSIDKTVLLLEGDPQVWGIMGQGFQKELIDDPQTVVTADKDYTATNGLTRIRSNLLQIAIPKSEANKVKNVLVKIGPLPAVILGAPKSTPPPAKVILDTSSTPTAPAGSAPLVEFQGENFDQVSKVSFGASSLPFSSAPDGKKLRVFLSRDVTAKPGRIALAVESKDGSPLLPANVDVQ